jgi:hypothetical protein
MQNGFDRSVAKMGAMKRGYQSALETQRVVFEPGGESTFPPGTLDVEDCAADLLPASRGLIRFPRGPDRLLGQFFDFVHRPLGDCCVARRTAGVGHRLIAKRESGKGHKVDESPNN